MTDTDNQACAVSFNELRLNAIQEFQRESAKSPFASTAELARKLDKLDEAEKAAAERDREAAARERARWQEEKRHDLGAVSGLADAMRAKLNETRMNRGGWWTPGCTSEALSKMLRTDVNKGDPVDVANYCAFLVAKGAKIKGDHDLTDIPVKRLLDLEAQNKQTYADPCPGNDYMRGYNNGIRLAHATIFGHEPDFIKPRDSEPVTDESGISVGAGTSRRADLAPAHAASYREVSPHLGKSELVLERVKQAFQRIAEKESASRPTATEVLREQQAQEKRELLGPEIGDTTEAVNVPEPTLSPVAQLSERIGLAPHYLVRAAEFAGELTRARGEFPVFRSAHEGLGLIEEELDEVRKLIYVNPRNRNYAEFRKETVQLGAMVLALLIEIVDPVNRAT